MTDLLRNPVKNYDWGSRTAIATLAGRPSPAERPEAEMWLGTHPSGSSSVLRQGAWHSLAETVAADPMAELGKETVKRFGTRLPYLLKLIAVDLPLSLQVHPSRRQAEEGYARGVYVDPFPKPELICALTPFTALAGFRPPREAAALIGGLGVPDLEPVVAPLAAGDASAALHALVEWPKEGRGDLVAAIARAASAAGGPDNEPVVRLARIHPEDPACLAPLFLQRHELRPGEALFLDAGVLHCYLSGFGVEIMGSSDNVLRAGLTGKPMDVDELLRVTDPSISPLPVEPVGNLYHTLAPEFRLGTAVPGSGLPLEGGIPRILVCTEGKVEVGGQVLRSGESAFVPASYGAVELRGPGTIFWAEPGVG
ncbi:mannose-6-phosphate isomerase, class I [Streptosporangium sp. NBC_01755]|uniref:mannose-6-phosphate isomerase, class I n=1 Tax=unclassified Streptosporangium TaxID=2632669 RepID=UPI002DD984A1|nr:MULTISPECIES: mannose-6-phosphate isomerase, class I [unclassified Streptosporangium]WSA29325.1 mannose-6-phosphate isomerase, class I [Streptosporangium sp. NBC_01810]WSC99233.1 mannose-6-phosphate isomerase, class I [Streptosporangium sp. NBC_01755]